MATTIMNTLTSSVMTGVSTFGNKVSDAFGINQATLSGAIDIVVIKHPPGSRPRCLDEEYKLNAPHTNHYPFDDISIDDFKDESQDTYICSPFHVRFGKLQLLRSNEVNVSITINDEQIDNLQMKLGAAGEAYFVVPTNKPLKHKKLLTSPLIKPKKSTSEPLPNTSLSQRLSSTSMPPLEPIISAEQLPQLNLSKIMNEPVLSTPSHLKVPSKVDSISIVVNDDDNNGDIAASSITRNSDDVSIIIDQRGDDDKPKEIKDESVESKSNHTSPSKSSPSKDGKETSLSVGSSGNSNNGGDNIQNDGTMANSPTLSVTSSILEDREVMSQLNIDSASYTGTDNESATEESNMESLDGDHDLFNNFSATHVMVDRIEMSLCGHLLSADSDSKNKEMFEKHKISYFEFCENPSLVFDSNLIILYNKQLYPAKIAFPMLFALLSFGKSLSKKAIKKLNKKEEKKEDKERKNTDDLHSEDVDNNDYSWYWSWFRKRRKKKKKKNKKKKIKIEDMDNMDNNEDDHEFDITTKGVLLSDGKMGYFRKSLRPTSEMLSKLPLKEGANNITFTVSSTLQGTQSISGCIFLWDASTKIVISDVDGTITKSDVMGHVAPLIVGSQWSHNGVAQLFTNIQSNGYRMLYLTSRGIGQSSVTRSYLFENVKQKNFSLPSGPIIMSPDSLTTAFYREVIIKKPQEFKIPALTNIQSLFPANHNPFYAGFGNRETDLESYLKVGVPKHRIFIIKPSGNINTNNSLFHTTYSQLNDDVDSLFMDQQNVFSKEKEEFNSFNYWRGDSVYYGNLSDIDDESDDKKDKSLKNININNANNNNDIKHTKDKPVVVN